MRTYLLLLLFLGTAFVAEAQFYPTQYRPPNQNWQQLQTPHFNIIFAEGDDSSAVQMGQILEQQYPIAQKLVGGELHNFPVILNSYNDRSNGFVTPFHFRSEIELPPIKGKTINPQSGNWLQAVGPHELVHALQFSNLGGVNFPAFLSLFGPDLAKSFHGAIPSGITEGLAVHHETEQVAPDGGRGNYPFFTNQFASVFESSQRWSMGQMVQASSNSRPFDRHYIGGYEFTSWLQDSYGSNTSQKALDFYMDFPFLGYGVALRHATGDWPGQLYDQFTEDKQRQLNQESNYQSAVQTLDIPYKGREIRRPKWLSDSTLVFYGSFYNARPGFYQYNLQTNSINQLVTTNSVGDYRYDLSQDRKTLLYTYYQTDPLYDNTAKSELVKYHINRKEKRQISKKGRLYAPVYRGNKMLALQSRPASSALVSVEEGAANASITQKLSLTDYEITAVSVQPDESSLAIIANKGGLQGLWIVQPNSLDAVANRPPDISFKKGSVFDPEWHPEGDKLLFSSDFSGTHQLYEYNLDQNSVYQLTYSRHNAFEGAYSPDGSRIAFIQQVKNERLPAVINFSKIRPERIDVSLWKPTGAKVAFMQQPAISDSMMAASQSWKVESYRSGFSWLKPRVVLPVIEDFSSTDSYRLGLALHSNDVLQSQAYSAEFSYLEDRLWYDLTYQNKQFFPGFKVQLYSDPDYFRFINDDLSSPVTLLRQRRDIALSIPFDIQLDQNIYSTSFSVEPEVRYSQVRFLEAGSSSNQMPDFGYSTVSNLKAQFNYRLQQNIRDIQPNSGLILFSELEHFWNASDFSFSVRQEEVRISLQQPTALRGGVWGYSSPFRPWNQSLRLGIEGLTQSGFVFDNQSLVAEGFSEPILINSNNLVRFNSRYTIPLTFPDDGGFLLPFYLSNIYLVAFSDSVTDPTYSNWYEQSRTVFGVELRSRFRLSNLSFDVGVGFGYEPTRNNHQFYIGGF